MSTLLLKSLLQNRYQIESLISRGGMGAVYQATDQRNGSTVALKQSFAKDQNMRKAFEREARILSRLRHPSLPVVSDYFADDETGQFLVMEYIPGDDLGTLLERKGKSFPTASVLPWIMRWADQLLEALEYLHTQPSPIIHRDIKPQNLKTTSRGDIILLDFGIAKSAADQTLHVAIHSVRRYTQQYAPLEQIQGLGTDVRSDLYALAATLYHLMTGVAPPDALNRVSSVLGGRSDPLRSAHELNPLVPPSVALVLHQTLEQKMADRFASARALRLALQVAGKNGKISTSLGKRMVTTGRRPITNSSGQQTMVEPPNETDSSGQQTIVASPASPSSNHAPASESPPPRTMKLKGEAAGRKLKRITSGLHSHPMCVVDQGGSGSYRTIGEAVADVREGTRIVVRPGHYDESLILGRSLEIIADGARDDVVIESSGAPCVQMKADYAVVRGFTLRAWGDVSEQPVFAVDIPRGRLMLEDCAISSDMLACVAIHGPEAMPVLWRCVVHDGKSIGVFVYDQARAFIEECDISGHMLAGIKISQRSNPVIRHCRISYSKHIGVSVCESGIGILESCDIFHNHRIGIEIKQEGNPIIRWCKVRDQSDGYGIVVDRGGEGVVEGCEIFGNARANVRIAGNSNPCIRKCVIDHDQQKMVVAENTA